MNDDALMEKAARAIQREHLHVDCLPDVTEDDAEQDFARYRHLYLRMANACADILKTQDLRHYTHAARGTVH